MQLSFDAADRLVELIHARRGAVSPEEAARALFALERAPATLAHSLLADVVEGDARLDWRGTRVALADGTESDTLIEDAELVVFDLETTGLSAARDRMCEIGAVRVKALQLEETFETLVRPGVALPPTIVRLTGLRDAELRAGAASGARGAPVPGVRRATRRSPPTTPASTSASSIAPSPTSPASASPRRSSTPCGSRGGCCIAGASASL